MLPAQQSSDNLIVLVSQDGKNLSEEFKGEGFSKPEDKPSNCSTLTLSAAERKPNNDQVAHNTNIQETFNPFILPDLSIMPEKEIERYFSQLRAMSMTDWSDLPRGIRCGHVKINLQYRKSRLSESKIAYKDLKKRIQRKGLPINEIEAPALAVSRIPFIDPYFKTQLEESKK